jgi:hypothetical protein
MTERNDTPQRLTLVAIDIAKRTVTMSLSNRRLRSEDRGCDF